jgi:secondary thiamine-phosphate synthase enzyme
MARQSITQNHTLTWAFTFIFILAFFPGLPQYLISLPFAFLWPQSHPISTPPPIICPAGCEVTRPAADMSWFQKTFTLPARSRGSYLITDEVVSQLPELKNYKVGILHLFVQHTSCGLSLNENWDEDVRADMSDALDRIAPEDKKGNLYRHSCEGADDMPVGVSAWLPMVY